MKAKRVEKLNKGLVALLLLGMTYLGLMLFLGTSAPFLIVRGTSMEPTLHAGDLLLNQRVAPTEIKVGDVIAFDIPPDAQQRLRMPPRATHRVIGIEGQDGQMVYVTQGDNSDVDPFKVPPSLVRGAVVENLGPLGWPILLLTNKNLLLFLGIPIVAFVLIVLATLWLSPREKGQTPAPVAVSGLEFPLGAMDGALGRLSSAVSEYGIHLKSHTSIIKHMAGSSEGLQEAVQQQNEILAELASVVREMKYHQVQSGDQPKGRGPANGHSKARNGTAVKKPRASTNGMAEPVAQPARTNGHSKSRNGIAELVPQPTETNGHNGDQPEKPILTRTKEERVKEMVAEMEARITANLD